MRWLKYGVSFNFKICLPLVRQNFIIWKLKFEEDKKKLMKVDISGWSGPFQRILILGSEERKTVFWRNEVWGMFIQIRAWFINFYFMIIEMFKTYSRKTFHFLDPFLKKPQHKKIQMMNKSPSSWSFDSLNPRLDPLRSILGLRKWLTRGFYQISQGMICFSLSKVREIRLLRWVFLFILRGNQNFESKCKLVSGWTKF